MIAAKSLHSGYNSEWVCSYGLLAYKYVFFKLYGHEINLQRYDEQAHLLASLVMEPLSCWLLVKSSALQDQEKQLKYSDSAKRS